MRWKYADLQIDVLSWYSCYPTLVFTITNIFVGGYPEQPEDV